MEIWTYPVGFVIGLLPVVADPGSGPGRAVLRLDGDPVCELSAESPSCIVDLGLELRIHLLVLERTDAEGRVTESVGRWINRPGIEAEVHAVGPCDAARRECLLTIGWGHPIRQEPSRIILRLDGRIVYRGGPPRGALRVSFPDSSTPRLLTLESGFPDGRTAVSSRLLQNVNPEVTGASLSFLPLELEPGAGAGLEERLRQAGWAVRALEQTDPEIAFVIEPGALESLRGFEKLKPPRGRTPAEPGWGAVRVLTANESLRGHTWVITSPELEGWIGPLLLESRQSSNAQRLRPFLPEARRLRLADGVALSAGAIAGNARPRAIVLIALGRQEDESTLDAARARAYLAETMVPLLVWRIGPRAAPGWPEGERLADATDLVRAMELLRARLEAQKIAWLEGSSDSGRLERRLPEGVRIAGREVSELRAEGPEVIRRATARAADSVYALAAGSVKFAGTAAGLLSSEDGEHWTAVPGWPARPVFALAFGGDERAALLAGTSGAIAVQRGSEVSEFPAGGVFALSSDPFQPSRLYAGTRRGVLTTSDAGRHWARAEGLDSSFVLSLAADPKRRGVLWAATAGEGVARSNDGGKTWKVLEGELQRTVVRCVALDPRDPDLVLAGTDGGVFWSRNQGRRWTTAETPTPRAPVYSLAADPHRTGAWYAGTGHGLFETTDGGRNWKKSSALPGEQPVLAIAFDPKDGRLLAGTFGAGVVTVAAGLVPER